MMRLTDMDEKVRCVCVCADRVWCRLEQPEGYSGHRQEACCVCVYVQIRQGNRSHGEE